MAMESAWCQHQLGKLQPVLPAPAVPPVKGEIDALALLGVKGRDQGVAFQKGALKLRAVRPADLGIDAAVAVEELALVQVQQKGGSLPVLDIHCLGDAYPGWLQRMRTILYRSRISMLSTAAPSFPGVKPAPVIRR